MHLEQEILKENVGSQDQIAAVYGGFNCIHFYKKSFKCSAIKIIDKNKKKFENWIQLFYIDQRSSQNVEKDKIKNLKKNKLYNLEITKIANKAIKILKDQKKNFIIELGKLLNEQWVIKKSFLTRFLAKK